MAKSIVYLGDTAIDQAASYLAGIMTLNGMHFDYLASHEHFNEYLLAGDVDLMIISDYPAMNFTTVQMELIVKRVKAGMSLLMIGGWESFTGLGGDYNKTPLADVLPVKMKDSDDRVNFSSPCMVMRQTDHPIIDDLPFDESVPPIGGLNSFEPKEGTELLLSAVQYNASRIGDDVEFTKAKSYPLLVVDQSNQGRTAAFASDVAPHWVGPLVDWGPERVKAKAQNAEEIEVGSNYAKFFANLINWLCQSNI